MAKTNIRDKAIKAVHSFNEFNEKYLVSLLWTSIAGLITLAAYGGLTNNTSLVLRAGLLVPVGSYMAFGVKYFIREKPRSFNAFVLSVSPLLIWVFSVAILLSIVPFVAYQAESRLNADSLTAVVAEDNSITLLEEGINIFPYFGTFYEALMFYLVVAYFIQWVGVYLKWSK